MDSTVDVAGPGEAGQLRQSKLPPSQSTQIERSWATQLIDPIGCPLDAKRVDLSMREMTVIRAKILRRRIGATVIRRKLFR